MKNHRDIVLIGSLVIIAIVIFIGFAVFRGGKSKTNDMPLPEPVTLETQSFAKSSSVPKAGAAKPKEEYNKIIAEYRDRRIQFDESCNAFPSNAVFKVGTSIMIDNRGSVDREITIGTHHTLIPAYDYMIYRLSSAETFSINCGPLKNPATIISQP